MANLKLVPRMLAALVLSLHAVTLDGEVVMGVQWNDDFDFDGLPGAQHEFKIEIGGGVEECFYQRVAQGALLHTTFQVLRGGDGNVDVTMRDSQWQVLDGIYWKPDGTMERTANRDETYAVCIDNTFGRFARKLVYLYIMTFIKSDWSVYVKQVEDLQNVAGNLTHLLGAVEVSVTTARRTQTQMRFAGMRDFYRLLGNNRYVQYWSIAQCVVIVVASVAQVVFLRRMFRTVAVTPTAKPRA